MNEKQKILHHIVCNANIFSYSFSLRKILAVDIWLAMIFTQILTQNSKHLTFDMKKGLK